MWSMSMHDFVAETLVKDAKQRRTAVELLQHPFIASCKARGRNQPSAGRRGLCTMLLFLTRNRCGPPVPRGTCFYVITFQC